MATEEKEPAVSKQPTGSKNQSQSNNTSKGGNSSTKKRNWAFIIYPESAPADWKDQLQQTGLDIAISPLHNKDVNPTGEAKKAHYHVIICYSGPTSFNVVKSITDRLNAPIPIPLEAVKGYYRYFTHKDNPEKYQYDEKDITTLNGFNISNYIELTKAEVDEIKRWLIYYIVENDIYEYSELLESLLENELLSEFSVASSHTLLFNNYIRSRKYRFQERAKE